MSDPTTKSPAGETNESFGNILSEFEQGHTAKTSEGRREGTVVSVSAESVILDIGFKTEGVLPRSEFPSDREAPNPGDKLQVTIKGRDPQGYYQLTRSQAARPTDWAALEKAFNDRTTIIGIVTGIVKGGLNVDVGARAFMPASRSGVRDASEMEKLSEQEIRCRIIKLDAAEQDIVVDRRIVAEEEEQAVKQQRYSELKEGGPVNGTVRSLTDYGAFIDIGGVDALLHVSDISWARINQPSDVLTIGQTIEAKVLKVNAEKGRISVGIKQLLPHPRDSVAGKYKTGARVRGRVTRVTEFGAFVQLAEGVEGMIHVSDISAEKRINHPQDVLRLGQSLKAQVLEVDQDKRRLKLGIKQLVPTDIDEYLAEHKEGDVVSGRVIEVSGISVRVELGEGIQARCRVSAEESRVDTPAADRTGTNADLASLSTMLEEHWKRGAVAQSSKPPEVRSGQVRSFRITKLDRPAKK